MDELSQPGVSDSEAGGDELADAPSSMAVAPPSRSPALTKKKQHPTYRGSLDLPFLNHLWCSDHSLSSRASCNADQVCMAHEPRGERGHSKG